MVGGKLRTTSAFVIVSLFAQLGAGAARLSATSVAGTKPFTVRDSIELTTIILGSESYGESRESKIALFSPDRTKFIVETRRGNVDDDVTIYSLLLYEIGTVRSWLRQNNADGRPQPRVLASRHAKNDWGRIVHIRWLSDDEIAFIAEGVKGVRQVFAVDLATGQSSQLTHSESNVTAFAANRQTVLYYAVDVPPADSVQPIERQEMVQLVAGEGQFWTAFYPRVRLFSISRASSTTRELQSAPMRIRHDFQRLWISPNADYAVALMPAVDAPLKWERYRVAEYPIYGFSPDRISHDPTSLDLQFRLRYMLIDLKSGEANPLIDAPSGMTTWNRSPIEVFWPRDGRSVIVSNTFVPLSDEHPKTEEFKRVNPAIAEIELKSLSVKPIAWEPSGVSDDGSSAFCNREVFTLLLWDEATQSLAITRSRRPCASERTILQKDERTEWYRRAGENWSEVHSNRRAGGIHALFLTLEEGPNERPRIYAALSNRAHRSLLLDPNPKAEHFTFGLSKPFRWVDRNGIPWLAGLILPVGYEPAKRYPLVVQTHGYSESEFLIDGPGGTTTAYAAQALANAGFAVLQVEDNAKASTNDELEASLYSEGFRSAIVNLVERGVVDPKRVGIIGWSRSGFHVMQFLAEHPEMVAAATISDCVQSGYWNYLLSVNRSPDIKAESSQLFGTVSRPERVADWAQKSVIFRLLKVNVPLRIEAVGAESLIEMWESYSLLKQADRPVDYVYFPQGSHSLIKPAERLGSQGGNVDWFRYWLLGDGNGDLAKRDQYFRWSKLRKQHDEILKQPRPPLLKWTATPVH